MIDYELSIWSHQDEFLGLLRGLVEFEGQAYSPMFKPNVNGDMSLTFSIPAVVFNKETGEFEDNRLWNFILNEQKIRLIRFKGTVTEEVYEFTIRNFTEKRDGIARLVDVECGSYAIYELARIGYSASFSETTMEDLGPSEKANLNYWMEKVLTYTKNKYDAVLNTSGWQYEIQPTTIYESNQITGYTDNGDGTFTPVLGPQIEKQRIIKIEKSNVFNIIQELAEKFSVWAYFEYEYNNFGKIISRKIIFRETIEQDSIYSITYGVNSTGLSKQSDSSALATKIFIEPVDSDLENTGMMSFNEAPQNLMMENFIYNFDYFKDSGFISEAQSDYIKTTLAYNIRNKNINIKEKQSDLAGAQLELNKLLADQEFITYEIAGAREMQQDALSRMSGTSISDVTTLSITYTVVDRGSYKFIDLSSRKGITSITSVKTFGGTNVSYTVDRDTSNPKYITSIRPSTSETKLKLVYTYNTYNYYIDLLNNEVMKEETLTNRLSELTLEVNSKQSEINSIESDIGTLISEKQTIIDSFEHDFYFAIKEANWKDSEYKLRKEYFYVDNSVIAETSIPTSSYIITTDLNNIDFTTIKVYKSDYSFVYFEKADFTIEYGKINGTKVLLLIPTESGAFVVNRLTGGGSTLFADNLSLKISYCLLDTGVRIASDLTINQSSIATISKREYKINLPNILYSTIVITSENGKDPLIVNTDYTIAFGYDSIIIQFKTTTGTKYLTNYYKIEAYKNITSQFYYNDAVEVATRTAYPNVSYSINAVDLSSVDGFELFIPKVGQKILISDRELHLINQYGFLSEISFDLDSPSNTQLTIANYKTRFEDLFQRIAATTQAINLRGDAIDRVLDTLPPSRIINPEILQRSVEENAITLSNSINNEVKWGADGITLTDKGTTNTSPGQVRLVSNGIFLSNQVLNGSRVWRTGITANGINASEITTGTLNTGKIIIWDQSNPRFLWNSDGLFAYNQNLDGTTNFDKYIKFNSDGILAWNGVERKFEIKANGDAYFGGTISANAIIVGSAPDVTLAQALTDATGMKPGNGIIIDPTNKYITSINANVGLLIYSGSSMTTGARIVLNGDGLYGYNSSNVNTFGLSSATGNASFSGSISGGTINGTAIYIPNSTSPVFQVSSTGVMTATSGTFSGAITGSTITGGSINIGSGRFDVNSSGDVYARYLRIGTDGCDVEGEAYFDDDLHVDGSLSSRYYNGNINSIGRDDCGTSSWAWDSVWAYDTSINSPSDRRLKKDIVPIKNGVDLILNLNPIQYKWNDGTRDHYGLIAQEVKETMTKVGIEDAGIFLDTSIEGMQDGKEPFYGLRYGEFISPMIQTIQHLEQRIKDLENKLGSI